MQNSAELIGRIDALEARLKRYQQLAALALSACLLLALSWSGIAMAQKPADVIRARGLVITDARGVERIIIGAPVPDAPHEQGPRISPATGMILMDENGRERFGIGLQERGMLAMGFDAAPGAGKGANRERLHLGVEPDGRPFIRFLENDSVLAGRLMVNDKDALELQFAHRRDAHRLAFSTVDIDGWRRLPDYLLPNPQH